MISRKLFIIIVQRAEKKKALETHPDIKSILVIEFKGEDRVTLLWQPIYSAEEETKILNLVINE